MSIWDAIERAAYTGLGLAALTKEKLDEAVETLKKERGLTESEGRRLAEELKDNAETARRNLDETVRTAVDKTLARMHLATRGEVEKLEARIADLEARLAGFSSGSRGAPASAERAAPDGPDAGGAPSGEGAPD